KALAAGKYVFLIRTIELHLGMDEATFNLNSRWNIILLRLDIHPWFDGMGFILIPFSIRVLRKMAEVASHNLKCLSKDARRRYNDCKELNRRTYRYRLVKLHMHPSRSIPRQQLRPDGTDNPNTRPEWHDYPYERKEMQKLKSHLNPFYALYHARFQINQAIEQNYIDPEDFWERDVNHPLFESLQLVKQITQPWYDPNTVPDSEFLGTDSPSPSPIKSSVKSGVKLTTSNDADLSAESVAGPSARRVTRSSAQSSSSSVMLAEDVFLSQPVASLSSRPPKKQKMTAAAEVSSENERGKGKMRATKASSDAGAKRTHQQAGLNPSP
ncbi:hypothetical protein BT96DRAFT_951841, partial [Gymnopus androsaceus JB14]